MPSTFIDVGTLRGLGTLLVVVAFICVVLWTYSGKRQGSFAEAAKLPFADASAAEQREEQASRSNNP